MDPILILADDLTGAADTGAQFARRGWRTVLCLGPLEGQAPPDAEVWVLDSDSRGLADGAAATRAMRAALAGLNLADFSLVYKKIDSTLRGYPAAELEALRTYPPIPFPSRSLHPHHPLRVPEGAGGGVAPPQAGREGGAEGVRSADLAEGKVTENRSFSPVLVAPAFPAQGRIVRGGEVFVHGVPLARTSFGGQGDLRRVFTDATLPIGGKSQPPAGDGMSLPSAGGGMSQPPPLLGLDQVRSDPMAIRNILERNAGLILADAENDDDLALLARDALDAGLRVLCGSAGLAAALAAELGDPPAGRGLPYALPQPGQVSPGAADLALSQREQPAPPFSSPKDPKGFGQGPRRGKPFGSDRAPDDAPPTLQATGPLLAVVGSLHPTVQAQVRAAVRQGALLVEPPPEFYAGAGEEGLAECAGRLAQALRTENKVVMATRIPAEAGPAPLDALSVARKLGQAVARALSAHPLTPVRGLALTGGDTARAVCRALGCTRLRLGGEVEPGMPWAWMADGDIPGLRAVTKAGGFGGEDALVKALGFLA